MAGATWRTAKSLLKLRDQLDAAYPARSEAADGFIGDAAHAKTASDHNPDGNGVVAAFDITHDPTHGLDIAKLADYLVASRDPRIKYIIRNGQILVPSTAWRWQKYTGADPHTGHLHLSVNKGNYDQTQDWSIGESMVPDIEHLNALYRAFRGRNAKPEEKGFINTVPYSKLVEWLDQGDERQWAIDTLALGSVASRDNWQQQIYDLQGAAAALSKRPTEDELKTLKSKLDALSASAGAAGGAAVNVTINGTKYVPEAK